MGCPSSVILADDVVFSVTTHDPSTATLTDADSDPQYKIYENLTAVPILTGTMSKLDDPGTTGFYATLIACTVLNGFELGKNYTIYIEATVNGVTGGISYGFNVKNCSLFTAGSIEWPYTVYNSVTLAPLEGVAVWISTDLAGTNIIWVGTTDALGVARDVFGQKPFLDPAPYFFWRQLTGYSFTNPDSETVV